MLSRCIFDDLIYDDMIKGYIFSHVTRITYEILESTYFILK